MRNGRGQNQPVDPRADPRARDARPDPRERMGFLAQRDPRGNGRVDPRERMEAGPVAVACPRPRVRPHIDMHELLKQEIYEQGGDPVPSGVEPPPPLIPPPDIVGFEDVELYFDSRQRDMTSNLGAGELRWDVTNLNANNDIKGCMQIHLREFYLPRPYSSPTAPDYFYEQRVFLEFLGAPNNQAILAGPSGRFHFEFRVENITGQAVRLIPLEKSYFFQRPLTSITEFYVRFMVPQKAGVLFQRVALPAETVPITLGLTAGAGTNPIQFTTTDTSAIGPVGAIPAVAIFISGFASPDLSINAAVNNPSGLFVTNVIDATTFSITGIDATALSALHTATMYMPKNRVAFPVRFTCSRSVATNNISVTHD